MKKRILLLWLVCSTFAFTPASASKHSNNDLIDIEVKESTNKKNHATINEVFIEVQTPEEKFRLCTFRVMNLMEEELARYEIKSGQLLGEVDPKKLVSHITNEQIRSDVSNLIRLHQLLKGSLDAFDTLSLCPHIFLEKSTDKIKLPKTKDEKCFFLKNSNIIKGMLVPVSFVMIGGDCSNSYGSRFKRSATYIHEMTVEEVKKFNYKKIALKEITKENCNLKPVALQAYKTQYGDSFKILNDIYRSFKGMSAYNCEHTVDNHYATILKCQQSYNNLLSLYPYNCGYKFQQGQWGGHTYEYQRFKIESSIIGIKKGIQHLEDRLKQKLEPTSKKTILALLEARKEEQKNLEGKLNFLKKVANVRQINAKKFRECDTIMVNYLNLFNQALESTEENREKAFNQKYSKYIDAYKNQK